MRVRSWEATMERAALKTRIRGSNGGNAHDARLEAMSAQGENESTTRNFCVDLQCDFDCGVHQSSEMGNDLVGDATGSFVPLARNLSKCVAQIYDLVFWRLKDQVIPPRRTIDRDCVMVCRKGLPKLDHTRIYRMNVARDNIGSVC